MTLSKYLKRALWAVLLLLTCIVLTGCGSGRRSAVEGTVTVNGQPANGTISFVPEDYKEGGTEHNIVRADIKDGKYSLDSSHGPLVGKYKVVGSVKLKTGKQIPTDEPPGMKEEEIDLMKNFNRENHTVEVKESDNKFDFTVSASATGGGGPDETRPPKRRDPKKD